MEALPLMYWIIKIYCTGFYKNPVRSRFIIASPKYTLKPLSKEKYYSKNRIWSGVEISWIVQNNKPVIDSINKRNSRKKAKQVSTSNFSTLCTKIPHNKLFAVLNSVIEFAFRGGTRDKICVFNNNAYE